MSWQQAHIQAAAAYLRERITSGATDSKTRAVYKGLLEVLDPNRHAARLRRELAESTKVVPVNSNRERRGRPERRASDDRRRVDLGSPDATERRTLAERRSGRDRRGR